MRARQSYFFVLAPPTFQLCDLRQVHTLLLASAFTSVKWGSNLSFKAVARIKGNDAYNALCAARGT